MRITVLGGGPAGLYFGILLRKADPAHEITVLERNAPDATFGWGVVFSEETLGTLRDADQPTYLEIVDTFARWDAVDIHYAGRLLRSRGHSFAAIARKRLLAILQRRCRELGVELRFETEVAAGDPMLADADLVVAADGANSTLRKESEDVFGTSVRTQGGKYVWFGTDLMLDAFTFIFLPTEFGLFQVHAYPFDETTSTFIVECPEPTWRSAGLSEMDEAASIAFCEKLFAEQLDGHRLLSNRSMWLSFPLIRNRSWHRDNIVLVGDAAHTAHFSIGSGTKLAMEDSIALAAAISRHGTNLRAALTDYELERQPVVERFQRAAGDSADYFQRVGHHADLEPIQFAFNLLTRSGRIGHAGLSVRDPGLVLALDTWLTGGGASVAPPPAFAPARIGNTVLRNRIARTGSAGGAGLVFAGTAAISAEARVSPDDPVITDERWKSTVDDVHAEGALACVGLRHAGRRGATRPRSAGVDVPLPEAEAWPLVAASPLPYGPGRAVPAELDGDGLAAVVTAFADAARTAAAAGFDVLELDVAHGYLLAGFLSPLANRRTDDYGGSPEARLRFPLAVLDAVRAVWPADRLLAVRLTVTDWARGGLDADEGIAAARALAAGGAELIRVEAGQTVERSACPEYRRGFLTGLSDRVRSEAKVPTVLGGYLTTLDEVNTIVGAGRADLCLLDPAPAARRLEMR